MYISIDKQRMAICHRHPLRSIVSNLVTIELPFVPSGVLPDDSAAYFADFTFAELRLLYENATGLKFQGYSIQLLTQQLLESIKQLPIADANAFEVSSQALAVKPNSTHAFRYVKGAFKPLQIADLFEPVAIKATGKEISVPAQPEAPLPRAVTPLPAAQSNHTYPAWHPLHKAA